MCKRAICIAVSMALVVACLPIDVCFTDGKLNIGRCEASATAVFNPLQFIEICAENANLSSSQFVATVAGVGSSVSGVSLGNGDSIRLGTSLAHNLDALIESADYPDWSTLSSEQQTAWGTKTDYDAAKFNSLLDAFDLEDARDSFYSSGGGDFELDDNAIQRLQQLGRIGSNWIQGIGNTVSSLLATQSNDYENVYLEYTGRNSFKEIKKQDFEEWPNTFPDEMRIYKGDRFMYKRSSSTTIRVNVVRSSTDEVYWINVYQRKSNSANNTMYSYLFSKSGFDFGTGGTNYNSSTPPEGLIPPSPSTNQHAESRTYEGQTYYLGLPSTTASNYSEANMDVIEVSSTSGIEELIPEILFGGEVDNIGVMPVDIVGYPQNINQVVNQVIYYPPNGYSNDTTWEGMTTENSGGSGGESGGGGETGTDYTSLLNRIIELLERNKYDAQGNLKVIDNMVVTGLNELNSGIDDLSRLIQQVKNSVDDGSASVVDALNDLLDAGNTGCSCVLHDYTQVLNNIQTALTNILNAINGIRTDNSGYFSNVGVPDLIGDLDFDELGEKSADLVESISSLAPFGALLLISDLVASVSMTGAYTEPVIDIPFQFMPGQDETVTLDMTWLEDLKPVINFGFIVLLVAGLAAMTYRLVELEAAG